MQGRGGGGDESPHQRGPNPNKGGGGIEQSRDEEKVGYSYDKIDRTRTISGREHFYDNIKFC